MTVGEYIKELRVAKNISQKELSALTGGEVSNAEISRLEAGIRKKPSPAILKILAPHLGAPVSALLARAGYMDEEADIIKEDAGLPERDAEEIIALEREIADIGKRLEDAERASQKAADDLLAMEKMTKELMDSLSEMELAQEVLARDKGSLEKELEAERDAAKANSAFLGALEKVRINGENLREILENAITNASAEDLETLGIWLRALGEGAFKASDMSMLKGFLKKYAK